MWQGVANKCFLSERSVQNCWTCKAACEIAGVEQLGASHVGIVQLGSSIDLSDASARRSPLPTLGGATVLVPGKAAACLKYPWVQHGFSTFHKSVTVGTCNKGCQPEDS